jgi:hypothetical protein
MHVLVYTYKYYDGHLRKCNCLFLFTNGLHEWQQNETHTQKTNKHDKSSVIRPIFMSSTDREEINEQ